MSQHIPENYRLYRLAETVARKIGVDLAEPQGRDRTLYDTVMSFDHPTDHLIRLAYIRGEVDSEVILAGEKNEALIHYSGAISKSTGKPVETVYATDARRVVVVTWGYPEDLGVLEVYDIKGSIALQELMGDNRAVSVMSAPNPQPYMGIAQFTDKDFDRLHRTIETLLD